MLNLMTEAWQESQFDLGGGLRFVDRLTAPHLIAYKSEGAVFLDQAGTGTPRTLVLADHGRSVTCRLAFSPDGRRLYHSAAQILEIDLESGRTRGLTNFSEHELYAATWDLFVSPDGSTLYFRHMKILGGKKYVAKVRALDIRDGHVRTVFDPDERDNVWRFSLDGSSGALLVLTTRPRRLLAMDLDGANLREAQMPEYGTPSPRCDRLDLVHGGVVHVPRARQDLEDFEPHGQAPSLSPDRTAVAFVRDNHELWLWRFAARDAECLARARAGTEINDGSGWSIEPVWSPDGRLLWFSSTTSTRAPQPIHPDFIECMRQEHGEGSKEFKRSFEQDHWSHTHHVGILDFDRSEVWMTKGHWRDVAWAP